MRIKYLFIKDYFLLREFSIEFTSNVSVLIGENGSGKSSIIECLAFIFGHLHKYFVLNDKLAEFIDGYRINYEKDGVDVCIESKYVSSKTNTFQPIIRINGEELSIAQIKSRYGSFSVFLPERVVLSYSGITEHLKDLNAHFENKFIQKIIRKNNPYSLRPLNLPDDNPFLYVKKEYISFVLMALFVMNTETAKNLLERIGVDVNGCTVSIIIKKPRWANSGKNNKDDNTLWGITSKIALDLFHGLNEFGIQKYEVASQTNAPVKIKYEFYGSLMVFDMFHSFFELRPDQVVSMMDTLLCDDLLDSVSISWGNGCSDDRLSEGEKQLILSEGLGLVMGKKNLLFLYDEPDVSLHPRWQQSFISSMTNSLDMESMAIITTHSPILVSNVQRSLVQILSKGRVDNAIEHYSFGRDINSILEDYFKVEERNAQGKDLIQHFYDAMDSKDYDEAEKVLHRIRTTLGPEDVTTQRAESFFDDLAE